MAFTCVLQLRLICVFMCCYNVFTPKKEGLSTRTISEDCPGFIVNVVVGPEMFSSSGWLVDELLSRPMRSAKMATSDVNKRTLARNDRQSDNKGRTLYLLIIMMIAGDIHANPGPNWKFPCQVCAKPVRKNQCGVQCDNNTCDSWYHTKCIDMTKEEYDALCNDESLTWECHKCLVPFSDSLFDSFLIDNNIVIDNNSMNSNLSDLEDPPDANEPWRIKLNEGLQTFMKSRGFKICHINVGNGGLIHHHDEVSSLCHTLNPEVLAVSETWLTPNTSTDCVSVPGYDFIRRDKPARLTGAQGVGLYIRHGLSYTFNPEFEHPNLMSTGIQVHIPNRKPMNIVVIYRHPQSKVAFYDHIDDLFTALSNVNGSYSVLTGDFNIDYNHVTERGTDANKLETISQAYGFQHVINVPTRITDQTNTCMTFANTPLFTAGVGLVSVADHLLNFITIGNKSVPARHRCVVLRNFKLLNEKKLVQDLKTVPWHVMECVSNVDDAWYI